MRFEHEAKLSIKVESSNLHAILLSFLVSLRPAFESLVSQIMLHYASEYARRGMLGGILGLELGDRWRWKSKKGTGSITINSLFGKIVLPNPVVEIIRANGKKERQVLGRKLLKVSRYAQIPDFMKEILGTLGGLMSFRNVEKSMQSFGIFRVSLRSIWRTGDWLAKRLSFHPLISAGSEEVFEADGTGVSTLGSGKRGSEAKILMQRTGKGGLRFLGVKVGKYNSKADWEALLAPLRNFLSKTKRHILVADGDDTIANVWKAVGKDALVFCQRCLWHIPRQFKYMLWKDNASKALKARLLPLCFQAFKLNKNIPVEEFAAYIEMKLARIDNLIQNCQNNALDACKTFIQNAKQNAFVVGRNTKDNHNTSLTERVMRTVKQRISYAVWSDKGVENTIKIRLNTFYNSKFRGLHFDT